MNIIDDIFNLINERFNKQKEDIDYLMTLAQVQSDKLQELQKELAITNAQKNREAIEVKVTDEQAFREAVHHALFGSEMNRQAVVEGLNLDDFVENWMCDHFDLSDYGVNDEIDNWFSHNFSISDYKDDLDLDDLVLEAINNYNIGDEIKSAVNDLDIDNIVEDKIADAIDNYFTENKSFNAKIIFEG